MEDNSDARGAHYGFLFHHLVAMFQTLALQQLGKLTNPITGQLERDLQQARITIDMLQMLKEKTAGNLEQSERMILDRALMDLQINYVDEAAREREQTEENGGDETKGEEGLEPESTEGAASMPEAEPEDVKEREGKPGEGSPPGGKRASAKRKTATTSKKKGKMKKQT